MTVDLGHEAQVIREDTYWCPWLLRPSMQRVCGYVQRGAGTCPFPHDEDVQLVPLFVKNDPNSGPHETKEACK